jgi:hypothetical protein
MLLVAWCGVCAQLLREQVLTRVLWATPLIYSAAGRQGLSARLCLVRMLSTLEMERTNAAVSDAIIQ